MLVLSGRQVKDIEIGGKFLTKDLRLFMRIKGIESLIKNYPGAVTVLSLDTYEVLIMNGDYAAEEIIERRDIGEESYRR